jgi:hypothetical protein
VTITHDFGALGAWQWNREQDAAGSQIVSEVFILSDLIPFVYGTPFGVQYRMVVGSGVVNGPSDDFTAAAGFRNTAMVLRLDTFDANQDAVANASSTGEGRTEYPGSPVPEPRALLLLALAGTALRRAVRQPWRVGAAGG